MIHRSVAVLEHHIVGYRRVWRGSVFSSFVLPVLFLIGMGVSVGDYVDARGGLDWPYLHYIAPGVLASTALQVAVGESTWPVYSGFNWHRMYHAMRASPLAVTDIVTGATAFVLLRVAIAVTGFLVVMALFGTVHSRWAAAAVPAGVLLGFATATPVFAYSAVITNDSLFAVLFRFAVIPMTLFAGVFFPVESLPVVARWLAYVSPLWHGVELCRTATLGTPTAWGVWVHTGYLMVWGIGGFLLARLAFARKLAD